MFNTTVEVYDILRVHDPMAHTSHGGDKTDRHLNLTILFSQGRQKPIADCDIQSSTVVAAGPLLFVLTPANVWPCWHPGCERDATNGHDCRR